MLINEFSFANAMSIHRIAPGCTPPIKPQHFRRLNEAHPDLKFDPFLVWRLPVCAARFG